jgi:hypothetical protein
VGKYVEVPQKREGEGEYYPVIKEKLAELFREKGADVYLEVTANREFSEYLKNKIPPNKGIVFSFLRKVAPDLMGYVEGSAFPGFVVVEVKKGSIDLDNIYQLKKYYDLFEARFAFLISLKPIPAEIKLLSQATFLTIKLKGENIYQAFALAHFDAVSGKFVEWFEENPFTNLIYWRRQG